MLAVAPRLTTTSFSAVASNTQRPSRQTWRLLRGVFLVVAAQHGRQRLAVLAERDVGDEAQPALVDAHQRHLPARQFARDAEHGAVAAHHHGQVAARPMSATSARGGQAGVERGVALERHLAALRRAKSARSPPARRAMPRAWYLPTMRHVPEARHAAITPRGTGGHAQGANSCSNYRQASYNENHARRPRRTAAEDPGGALHRRRPAGGFAHAVQGLRAGPVAGHHPQRDGRPGGAGPHRQPAHQRRARAHRARLPPVRRHHAHRAARDRPTLPPEMAAARGSCTPTSRSA
jgi:hypothetical protein